ncbi:MAG: FHA domain-containing protein [Candidatus Binatales bacterium]
MNGSVNRRELILKSMAGLAGGGLGWLPVEITSHGHSLTDVQTTASVVANFVAMALLSGLIGGLILAAEGQSIELSDQTKRRFGRGFIICALLSIPATYYSNLAFSYILNFGGWGINQQGSPFYLFLGRTAGWGLMGLMLGAGVGLASFSIPNVIKGAAGGWVGGFLGGLVFDAIGQSSGGLMSRLVGFCAVGLAIGLLIGLVQELTKAAWLSIEAGRLRGRQYRLERGVATVGRAEENAVGLFGDPSVLPRHAEITRRADSYILKSLSPQQGVFLNGGRIESAELHDGDRIKIGNYEMAFHLRNAPLGASWPAPASPPPIPAPARVAAASARAAAASAYGAAASPNGVPYLVGSGGHRFDLRGGVTRLGRALDNDVVVDDSSVSRYHANIRSHDGAFELVDLNSRNGTFVADRRITEARLSNGDSIRLGDAQFTFRA